MELLHILADHAQRYPLMQPVDAVKLLYQNEFGGGHLIKDPQVSLARLQNELASVSHKASAPLIEEIGNGMVRIYLTALTPEVCSPEHLNELFVRSAAAHTGSMESFLQKLKLLEDHFPELHFAFSRKALDDYLAEYRAAGCPMVSHSTVYNAAYHPAYRIVCREFFPIP